jgi:molybdopterin synthase catalytic subunit
MPGVKVVKLHYYAAFHEAAGLREEDWRSGAATAAELYDEVAALHGFRFDRSTLRVALNDCVVSWESEIRDGDTAALAAALSSSHAGAFVSFEGRVRDVSGGRTVVGLEYDAYPAMCLAEGEAVVQEAVRAAGIIAARCVHRVGRLSVGEAAVWVGVMGGHRDEAFQACRFIIDEVKRRVPIWKKEQYDDGTSGWIGLEAPRPGSASAGPAPSPR